MESGLDGARRILGAPQATASREHHDQRLVALMATDFKPKTQTFREPDVHTLDHRLTDLLPRPFGRPAGSVEEHDLAVGDRQVLQDAGGTSEAVIAHQPHAPRSAGARPEMRIRPAGCWQTRYQRLPP